MFDINNISYDTRSGQYRCFCQCRTAMKAQEIAARFLPSVRMRFGFTTELISQGSTVILAGPSEMETRTAAEALNQAMQRQQDAQQ